MLVIGLTGGICSGKSTATRFFQELGVPVIDADIIARELVEPGTPALARIVAIFGDALLTADGTLDRKRLRNMIFADAQQRRTLETILHPLIHQEMERRIATLTAPYCIISVPLLLESGQRNLAQRVLVIDTTPAEQRRRLKQRDRLSDSEINAVLNAQASRQERLAVADDVIGNDHDLADLRRQVEQLHQKYLALAKSGH